MDILMLLIVTAVVAGGGHWMASRESMPTKKHQDRSDVG